MGFEQMNQSIAPELHEVDQTIGLQLRAICAEEDLLDRAFGSFFGSRGKKLRPRLVFLSAFALRQDNLRDPRHAACHRSLVDLAAIVELVHSASLMHDDVLDEAATRRGQHTLNALFGNKAAILAGDILYSHAFELLVDKAHRDTALWLTKCVRQMCGGEIVSLSDHGLSGYLRIIEDKTASLMAFCCRAGIATVCRETDTANVLHALTEFGHSFGMAYQIADDLCDDDSQVAIAEHERVRELLQEYIRSADHALRIVPPSIYKDDLVQLLRYIEQEAEPLVHRDARRQELAGVGSGKD